MFLEKLFFNVAQPPNVFESWPLDPQAELESFKGIRVRTTFLPGKTIAANLRDDRLTFYMEDGLLQSNCAEFIYYLPHYQIKEHTISYKLMDFTGTTFTIIEVESKHDRDFRSLFRSCFIFTDFTDRYLIQKQTVGVKSASRTLVCSPVVVEAYAPTRYLVECFAKREILDGDLATKLFESIRHFKRLNCNNLKFVNFYESEHDFYVLHGYVEHVMLEEFMEVFTRQEHKSFLFKSLYGQIVDQVRLVESAGCVAPFLHCKNMMVCLNTEFRKQATRKKSTLKQSVEFRYFDDSKESVINKILKQILVILKIYAERNQNPDESIDEEVLIADVASLVQIRFLNNVLLFPRETKPPEVQNSVIIGNYQVLLFSNYVQFFSPNINCVVLGILAVFLLTKTSLFWTLEDFSLGKKNSYFLSFPVQLMIKLNPREKAFVVQAFAQEKTQSIGDLFQDYLQNAQRIWKKSDLESQSSFEMVTEDSEVGSRSMSSTHSIKQSTSTPHHPILKPLVNNPSGETVPDGHRGTLPSQRQSGLVHVQFPSAESQGGAKNDPSDLEDPIESEDSEDETLDSKYGTLSHVTPHLFNRLCFD